MFRIICLIIGYAFGCLQSAYFIGRLVGHIDIRDYGSGNAGFTNTTRILGKKAGAVVFAFDLLKLIVAFYICSLIFNGNGSLLSGTSYLPGIYGGLGVVLGHNFPFYLGFRGGKGIACTLGLMLCVDWRVALVTYIIGFCIFMTNKYISVGSLSMALMYPVFILILNSRVGYGAEAVVLLFILCALAFIKHRTNIQRLLKGTERKFGEKEK